MKALRSWFFASAGTLLLRALFLTYRWHQVGEIPEALLKQGPIIGAFWHNQQLCIAPLFSRSGRKRISRGLYALASRHSDGRIIAGIMQRLGFKTIAGSSKHGGAAALKELISVLGQGFDVAITPDGPRGPVFVAKEGIGLLATQTGAPIIPAAYTASSAFHFKSWDRMFLPKPFATISWRIGHALYLPSDMSTANAAAKVTEALNAIQFRG